jgi:hypothetical protein
MILLIQRRVLPLDRLTKLFANIYPIAIHPDETYFIIVPILYYFTQSKRMFIWRWGSLPGTQDSSLYQADFILQ